MSSGVKIRSIAQEDKLNWKSLFSKYLEFYDIQPSEETIEAVWAWLHDAAHPVTGVVAEKGDGALIGLVHYQSWPVTLLGGNICYASDAYVEPEERASGVMSSMVARMKEDMAKEGLPQAMWLTAEDNPARVYYDRVGEKTNFVVYTMSQET